MALTVTKVKGYSEQQLGKVAGAIADVQFDNSYATGGEAVTPAMFGFKQLIAIQDLDTAITAGAAGKQTEWDKTNGKLKLLTGALVEAANLSDQSGVTRRVLALGV
jgi:hypothetical protein